MPKLEIKYDFNNAKSLKIYPRKNREPISDIPLSSPKRVIRRALNAAEKELKHLMSVADRRLERIHALMTESIKDGHHLVDEIFIPEYLGFSSVCTDDTDDDIGIRVYSKDGFNMTRIENENWLIYLPSKQKQVLRIRNMFEAILILGSIGMDLNIKEYLDGKYNNEKPIEEVLNDVLKEISTERVKQLELQTKD